MSMLSDPAILLIKHFKHIIIAVYNKLLLI